VLKQLRSLFNKRELTHRVISVLYGRLRLIPEIIKWLKSQLLSFSDDHFDDYGRALIQEKELLLDVKELLNRLCEDCLNYRCREAGIVTIGVTCGLVYSLFRG
jgi:hypothetical protein